MKQELRIIEEYNKEKFKKEVDALLEQGYEVTSTHIGARMSGSYDEASIFQAILVKTINRELVPKEQKKINFKFKDESGDD